MSSYLGVEAGELQGGKGQRRRQEQQATPKPQKEEKSELEKDIEEDPLTFCGKAVQGTTLQADNEKSLNDLKELARRFGDEKAVNPFEQAFLKDDMFIEMEKQRDRVIAGG